MAASPGEVTQLLAQAKGENEEALAKLIPIVYKELRRLAGQMMRRILVNHAVERKTKKRTDPETVDVLGLPAITVKREWTFTKAWLHRELSGKEAS